jgi:hypothetical protein
MGFWTGVLVGMGLVMPIFVFYRICLIRKVKENDFRRLREMRAKYNHAKKDTATLATQTPLYEVPEASTAFEYTELCGDILRYDYWREGESYRSGIRFKGVLATYTRAERCSKIWHIDPYDTLVRVDNSPWVRELRADTTKAWRDEWAMNHYMIYLDSAGSIEVIADSWEVIPEEAGTWKSI